MRRLKRFISSGIRLATSCIKTNRRYPVRLLGLLLLLTLSYRAAPSPEGREVFVSGSTPYLFSPQPAELTPDRALHAERIESFFNQLHTASGFNGTVLFAENGEIIFSKAYGYANMKEKDSLTIESAFQLASISKPITAIATLMLVEQGAMSLEDSVQRFIPDFPYPGVTIRHLLSHRSGLPNYMYLADELWPDQEITMTNKDMIDMLINNPREPYYPPNRRYNYSNTNFAVLAYLVETVSDVKFEDFVTSRIFTPCGMVNSSIYCKANQPMNLQPVVGYVGTRKEADNSFLNGVVGDKGVYASAVDMLKFDQALYAGLLISPEMLEEAYKPHHKDLRINDNYGLGWRLDRQDPDHPLFYHGGWWKGFKTQFVRETTTRRTIIVLSNTLRGNKFNHRELAELFT